MFDNKLFLAPLAGITDHAFRMICRAFGADIVFSEMISAEGLVRDSKRTYSLIDLHPDERPYGIQIFGYKPHKLAAAAEIVQEKYTPEIIDLNCGCPVKKVIRNFGGSYLMKDAKHLENIIREMRKVIKTKFTVKIRLGWDKDSENYPEILKIAEDYGVDAVTIHGRTKSQVFSGSADWDKIKIAAQSVKIPVIGNGDIFSYKDFLEKAESSGCSSVMIGRGSMGSPWIFRQIKERDDSCIGLREKMTVLKKHFELNISQKGNNKGLVEFRKHFGWYLKGIPGARPIKQKFMTTHDFDAAKGIIEELCNEWQ